jgi:hypothetical protein
VTAATPPLPGMSAPPLTALEMARDWAKRAYDIAAHYQQRERDDPGFGRLEATIHGAGNQQFQAAQMASFMALVSIAEDTHRIADAMEAARFRP